MIIVTGAAGFIGSFLVAELLRRGQDDLLLVDEFSRADKLLNLANKPALPRIHRDDLFTWLQGKETQVSAVIHLGARTDTTEQDWSIFEHLNVRYSQAIWQLCQAFEIPLVYASSAATYGDGSLGFSDDPALRSQLQPMNPYGRSKQTFDLWAAEQASAPPSWVGLKFFNVYGPNEYHKGRMASVVWHAYPQVRDRGELRLFRSHRPDYADGEQRRDFIYVRDVVEVIADLLTQPIASGIYNLGSGQARSFLDLGHAVFDALHKAPKITFIDIPADIRNTYQYYTEADLSRLRAAGVDHQFRTLEEGITEYLQDYLSEGRYA